MIKMEEKTNYLVHHGIQGQRWGVRRYQNSDGSLTPAGRNRYGVLESAQKNLLDRVSTLQGKHIKNTKNILSEQSKKSKQQLKYRKYSKKVDKYSAKASRIEDKAKRLWKKEGDSKRVQRLDAKVEKYDKKYVKYEKKADKHLNKLEKHSDNIAKLQIKDAKVQRAKSKAIKSLNKIENKMAKEFTSVPNETKSVGAKRVKAMLDSGWTQREIAYATGMNLSSVTGLAKRR